MKLWILQAKNNDQLWEPWYDKAFGFVVCAETEDRARELAQKECGDEGCLAWSSVLHSACVELVPGEEGIIIRDFSAA